MGPTERDPTAWTIIFVGAAGERSSMKVLMTKEKLAAFLRELRPKTIGQPAFSNEVGDRHQFAPNDLFVVPGHLYKLEDIKNAKP